MTVKVLASRLEIEPLAQSGELGKRCRELVRTVTAKCVVVGPDMWRQAFGQ